MLQTNKPSQNDKVLGGGNFI